MKNLLIYTGPNKAFSREDASLTKIQIDNSLKLGWKRDDMLLVTDFSWEYNGVKAIVVPDGLYYDFDANANKTRVIVYMFKQKMIDPDELYWCHDLDAYELNKISEQELGLDGFDAGFVHYVYKPEWQCSSFFFTYKAKDIFELLDHTIQTRPWKSRNNEKTLTWLIKHNKIAQDRYKKLNVTYSITKRYLEKIYPEADKPLKVLHFRPSDTPQKDPRMPDTAINMFMYGKNPIHIPLMNDRLIQQFRYHRITPHPTAHVTPLCELAYQYGTDKCPQIDHTYTPFYFELLKNKRHSVKKVLEIGVGHPDNMQHVVVLKGSYKLGASLYMWRDFFPNAQIYGADIRPESMFTDDRIATFLCDQNSEKDLLRLLTEIGTDLDLIIDDGSHKPEDQIATCQILMPLLKRDVLYIIEDVIHSQKLVKALQGYDCWVPPIARQRGNNKLVVVKNDTVLYAYGNT